MPITNRQSGFTYLAALLLIVIMGTVLAATGVVWHTAQQREKERELLYVGDQFRRAIGLYYERTPGKFKKYPNSLQDLLKDERHLSVQRYLRKIYLDPMTRKAAWGIVPAPGGGIMGVYSLSEEEPRKTGNFPFRDSEFEGKGKYAEWQFVYQPQTAQNQPASVLQQSQASPQSGTGAPLQQASPK